MSRLSVIIPVYNTAPYLRQCLDSLLAQTCPDWEAICVDDGSTDESPAILTEYAAKDSRFTIITQTNQGQGAARNNAIPMAAGEYISFVDSDDWLDDGYVETILDGFAHSSAEAVLFTNRRYNDASGLFEKNIDSQKRFFNELGLDASDTVEFTLSAAKPGNRLLWPQLAGWSKACRTDFLVKNNIQFGLERVSQDQIFSVKVHLLSKTLRYIHKELYIYRIREGSAFHAKNSDTYFAFFDTQKYIKDFLLSIDKLNDFKGDFDEYLLWHLKYYFIRLPAASRARWKARVASALGSEINGKFFGSDDEYPDLRWFEKVFSIKSAIIGGEKRKQLTVLGKSFLLRRSKSASLLKRIEELEKRQKCFDEFEQYFWLLKYATVNREKVLSDLENMTESGISKSLRSPKLIVSLTSYPARMYDIHYCLYSLLTQSVKPDMVILWLAESQFPGREADLPKKVLSLRDFGLTIRWCEDIRSYKKLIPALREYPEDAIVTADDDIFYRPDWLEKMYSAYQQHGNKYIYAHRCHRIRTAEHGVAPYKKWSKFQKKASAPMYSFFCTSGGGVLYPPGALHSEVQRQDIFQGLCPDADDIWFWAMAVCNGRKIFLVDNAYANIININPERVCGWYGSEDSTLYLTNEYYGNDVQMNNVLGRYPSILQAITNEG